ncbi:metal-dependent hydrolase [Acidovorax sp. DW039]|uniref:metal-dependent hydrolase n=1 Tax=Acidovorax sp. DW039 TaxID=3095606 RepID=UPI00308E1EAA|nr:metal-dependent hydrolase [Acidovorax sp. DW039]
MTELVVRRLLIDLEAPMPRHWCGGDAFRTALFNALSMSFPMGEQFFIDSVRDGHKTLPPDKQAAFAAEVRGFIGQEATHRRLHSLFNNHLEQRGLRNLWAMSIEKQRKMFEGLDPRHALAVTAANEHFTAVLAEWLLSHPEVLNGSEERLQTLWLWHSAEEAEHKNTAFDLYHALGGDHHWRIVWFRRTTMMFLLDVTRQILSNLRRDGSLYRPSTWASAWRTLLGANGLVRQTWRPWKDYFRRDFHPSQRTNVLSLQWLQHNRNRFIPVGERA